MDTSGLELDVLESELDKLPVGYVITGSYAIKLLSLKYGIDTSNFIPNDVDIVLQPETIVGIDDKGAVDIGGLETNMYSESEINQEYMGIKGIKFRLPGMSRHLEIIVEGLGSSLPKSTRLFGVNVINPGVLLREYNYIDEWELGGDEEEIARLNYKKDILSAIITNMKGSGRKSKRKASKRKASKRKASKRRASKRRASKRRASKRRASKRK